MSTFLVPHTPVTSAPNALAICTANVPTPPDAPLIKTCLPWLDLPLIAQQLEGGGGGHPDGCGLREREVGRLRHEVVRSSARILGEGARAPAEDLIAHLELRHVLADGLHCPCDIRSWNTVLWPAQPGKQAEDVGHASHQEPVPDVDGGRVNAHHHLVILDHWLGDVLEREDRLGRAVLLLDDCPHHLSLRCRSGIVLDAVGSHNLGHGNLLGGATPILAQPSLGRRSVGKGADRGIPGGELTLTDIQCIP